MLNRVNAFIEDVAQNNIGVEAVALYQDGEMKLLHRFVNRPPRLIYSHTKSFVATAAGMAVDEGKLDLDDRIIKFFPECDSIIVDDRMRSVTVRHLLTMSSGIGLCLLSNDDRRKGIGAPDYVSYFFSHHLKYDPGTKFVYSNADTHMVGCVTERAVGERLQRYLYKKLFSKLEIGYPAWECDPSGTAFGGSGLYLDITQMMKLGILYLNEGKWNNEQIVSKDWVEQARKRQIYTGENGVWDREYGFQFWMCDNVKGAFRADGAYGQISVVFPHENAVVAFQRFEDVNTSRIFKDKMIKYLSE